ncbi:hypothetical protein [Zhihengliuella flava]|uniref:Uncharacterized protein n=1 Tax=Zhihengliuella flava TaxID=1285193 RepID=A0A931GHH6_9MICC|nr:hypothetical protein [Zhihengliuella flava]MBG6083256.1 hypothetical protein [Zhihengliuella flava]
MTNQPALFTTPNTTQPTKKPATKEPLPEWLRAALETKTGGFRTAKFSRCPQCGAITLTGLNADQLAQTITADPTPLTPTDEYACTLTNRPTIHATHEGNNRWHLHYRDHLRMTTPPSDKHLVLPTHKCGARFPGFLKPPHLPTNHDPNATPPF